MRWINNTVLLAAVAVCTAIIAIASSGRTSFVDRAFVSCGSSWARQRGPGRSLQRSLAVVAHAGGDEVVARAGGDEEEFDFFKGLRDVLGSKEAELKEQLRVKEASAAAAQGAASKLETEVAELEASAAGAQGAASKLEAEVAELVLERARLQDAEVLGREKIAQLESERARLQDVQAVGREKIAELESQLEEERASGRRTGDSELESELEKERAALRAQEDWATAAERSAEELASEQAAGRERITQLESELVAEERAAAQAQKKCTAVAESSAEELAAEVARLTSALEEAAGGAQQLRAAVASVTFKLEVERSAGQELQAQIAALQASYSDVNDRFEASQSLQEKTLQENKLLSQEVAEVNAKAQKLRALLVQKTSQLEAVEARMSTVTGSLSAAAGALTRKFKKRVSDE